MIEGDLEDSNGKSINNISLNRGKHMQLNLQIIDKQTDIPTKTQFNKWVKTALPKEQQNAELTIRIVDQNEIKGLNSKYRHKNKPTNVLSFPTDLPPEIDINLLGDIVVCAEVVAAEAKEQNKTLDEHWAHIVIHGVLHLLGYDHIETGDAEVMEAKEVQILDKLGYENPY